MTLGVYCHTQLPVAYCFYACECRPPGFAHSLFLSQARCSGAMWPCCDFTSSDDDEHNTDNNFLLLFADIGIAPTLLDGLTDVDVLHIALGCGFALYLLSYSIILPPLSLVLSLTVLSSFYFERCSHTVVLSSLPTSWLAQCGFSCLEYCVRPSQSVISRASLTLCEASTCATRSCIYCLYLRACTICSIASLLPLCCVPLSVSVL